MKEKGWGRRNEKARGETEERVRQWESEKREMIREKQKERGKTEESKVG